MFTATPGSEPIVVNLTPTEIKAAAGGEPVEVIANVRNATTTVDQYKIEVESLDPTWYTVGIQSVSLFPGDSAPIPIKLHPPKGSGTRAGHYTFTVKARSHSDPTIVGVTKGVLQVGSYSIFQVELAPKRVTAWRGKYRLTFSNGGNSELQLDLEGKDSESELLYKFSKKQPTVPPGTKLVVPLTVRRPGLKIIGQQKRFQFAVISRPTDGEEKDAKEVVGEFIQKPPMKGVRGPLLATLLGLVLLFLISPSFLSLCRFPLPYPLNTLACNYDGMVRNLFAGGGGTGTPTPGPGPTSEALDNTPVPNTTYVFSEGFKKCHDTNNNAQLIGEPTNSEQNFDEFGNARQSTSKGTLLFIRDTPQSTSGEVYFISNKVLFYCPENGNLVPMPKP